VPRYTTNASTCFRQCDSRYAHPTDLTGHPDQSLLGLSWVAPPPPPPPLLPLLPSLPHSHPHLPRLVSHPFDHCRVHPEQPQGAGWPAPAGSATATTGPVEHRKRDSTISSLEPGALPEVLFYCITRIEYKLHTRTDLDEALLEKAGAPASSTIPVRFSSTASRGIQSKHSAVSTVVPRLIPGVFS
jgi:hypothetical protein